MGPGILQQSQTYHLDSYRSISIAHLCWLCTLLWHNHQECLHSCESPSARKCALSLPHLWRRDVEKGDVVARSPTGPPIHRHLHGHTRTIFSARPIFLRQILTTRRLKEKYEAGLFRFAGNECTYLFVLSPQFLLSRYKNTLNWQHVIITLQFRSVNVLLWMSGDSVIASLVKPTARTYINFSAGVTLWNLRFLFLSFFSLFHSLPLQ